MPPRPPLHHGKVASTLVHDTRRSDADERGYDARWQRARLQFLREHPLCTVCHGSGRLEAAAVVDHIQPHRGSPVLFWDMSNWQPLCKRCHDRKTALEQKLLKAL